LKFKLSNEKRHRDPNWVTGYIDLASRHQKKEAKQRIGKLSGVLGSFVLNAAVCGAFVTSKIGFWSVLFLM